MPPAERRGAMSRNAFEMTLPREAQSGNALAYSHWRVHYRDKMAWKFLMGSAIARADVMPVRATGPRHVTFTAYRKRRLDDDNLIAGLKHCRDMLVHFGLLVDDSRQWAAFTYAEDVASKSPTGKPCTRITIEEA